MEVFTSHVEIRFSWCDWWRLLFGRTAHVRLQLTAVDLPPYAGPLTSTSEAWVEPLWRRRPIAMEAPGPTVEDEVVASLKDMPE